MTAAQQPDFHAERNAFRRRIESAPTVEALLSIEAEIDAAGLAEDAWLNGFLDTRYRYLERRHVA